MDETTFHTWLHTPRSWMKPGERVRVSLPGRVGRVTLYGAIGSGLRKPVFMLGDSTNIEEFKQFVRLMA